MKKETYIRNTLFYLNFVGANPENQTIFSRIRLIYCMGMSMIFIILVILETIINWNGINSLLEGLDAVVALIELKIRMTVIVSWNKKVSNLLNQLNHFWPEEDLDDTIKKEIKTIHKFTEKFWTVLKICFFITCAFYSSKPFLGEQRKFVYDIYQPFDLMSFPVFQIVCFLQMINALVFTIFMIGFDYLFIGLLMYAFCELKIISYQLQNLKIHEDEERSLQDLNRIVEYHNFVLIFIKQASDVFSFIMLSDFLVSTFCICLGLLSLSGEGFPPNLSAMFLYGLYLISYGAELYIFCAGGHFIIAESANIANAAYNSNWWIKTQPKFRRAVALIILRAQKGECLTAGGMFDLNLSSYTSVMNTGMSFFTLVQAVYKKDRGA